MDQLVEETLFSDLEPENRLKFAILKDAILCLRKQSPDNWYGIGLNKSNLELLKEREAKKARAWIKLRDYDYPLSFENICTSLKIDSNYLRSKLC